MRLCALSPADSDAAAQLFNAAAPFDCLTPALFAEKTIEDAAFDPALAIAAIAAGDFCGFGVAVLRDGGRGYVKLLAVAPAVRRRGIGRDLLRELERRLAARGARSVRLLEAAPNYLSPGIDTRDAAALAFAAAAGYQRVGEAEHLAVALRGRCFAASQELTGTGCVRRAGAADRAALHAFLNRHWPAWIDEADRALGNSPPSLHIALDGDAVVGFAATEANNAGTGSFGPMGVAPGRQRTGIGRALLFAGLDDLQRAGHDVATIAWVANREFYARAADATPLRHFVRFEKVLAA